MNHRVTALLLAATLGLTGSASAQPAAGEDEVSFEAVFGGQSVNDVDRRGLARFERYGEVPDGAVFESARFAWKPAGKSWTLSLSARDAFQDDQRYFLHWTDVGHFSLRLSHVQLPHLYSTGSTTLWSGIGTGNLTVSDALRQGIETAAGSPISPVPATGIRAFMDEVLAASGQALDLQTQRKVTNGELTYKLTPTLSATVTGRYERREGAKTLGFGTYIRRQALTGIPGTGPGNFWKETIEPRGAELAEPVDHRISEVGAALTWARKGHSVVVGWQGSFFRNDTSALYFDNPFEAAPGQGSAITFDPRADQEPAAPNGNNALRGLTARSVMQLAPDNDFSQVYGNGSFKLGSKTRVNTALSYGTMKQDDAFLPYAENGAVVFSGVAGQPGAVYARDAALPRSSLDGRIAITRADLKLTTRPTDKLRLRGGFRYYDYKDESAQIFFPGYSSSGDSFFRRGVGQKDATGTAALFNSPGSYDRQRLDAGVAYRFGQVTLDGEYVRTGWDYDERQVDKTSEDTLKASVRYLTGDGVAMNAYYLTSSRDFDGSYDVGLEKSGVRAFDVWNRDRDRVGAEIEIPFPESWTVSLGGHHEKAEYPGAVATFSQPYGLQDSLTTSVHGGLTWADKDWTLGAFAGFDRTEWNTLQVTKTSQGADYNPINRWTREAGDDTWWLGLDVSGKLGTSTTLRADVNYQKYSGDWLTANLATPDVNSAVAYAFPALSDSTFSGRLSLLWTLNSKVDFEARYLFEPFRLDDFTWDVQPYMQGVIQQTQASPADVGEANVSRMLWLDSRYDDYDAHVVSAFVHVRF